MNPERTMKIWTIPSAPTRLTGVVTWAFAIGSRRKRGKAMNVAKTTLVSTVVAAAFGLALALMVAPAWATHKDRHNPGGGGGGENPIVYTVTITMGGFKFENENINFIANSRENKLIASLNAPLELRRAESTELETWNQVFNTCSELLAQNSVPDFTVNNGQFVINKDGGVEVVFGNILFLTTADGLKDANFPAEVTMQLRGRIFDFDGSSFLPKEFGVERKYDLVDYVIYGGTLNGISPRSGCRPRGSGGGAGTILLDSPSELVITAVSP